MPRGVYKRKPARKLSTRGQRVVKKIRRRSNPGVHDDIPTIAKSSLIKSSISPASTYKATDDHIMVTVRKGTKLVLYFE